MGGDEGQPAVIRGALGRVRGTGRNEQLRLSWERRTEPLMLVLAVATLPLVLVPEVAEVGDRARTLILYADAVVWAAFVVDLAVRTWLSEQRGRFLVEHPFEVLIVVIPVLRPLRLLRFVRILRPLAASGFLAQVLRKRSASWALVAAGIAIALGTLVVGVVERDIEDGLQSWGTVIWWGLATITTVGYGDVVPVTTIGRVVGAFLMLVGIGVFGVLTANVAAWFVEQDKDEDQQKLLCELANLQSEVRLLREELAAGRVESERPGSN